MGESRKFNIGGYCAIAAGIAYVIVGIAYFNLPEIQRGTSDFSKFAEYLTSVAADSTMLQLQYWCFSIAAFMGLAVIIAAKRYIKDSSEDILDWASVLGLIGYGVMCTNFVRLAYLLPQRAQRFAEGGEQLQQAMLGANALPLDPTGILGFGFVGFWFLILNYLARDRDNFPNELAYIGIIGGILHIFVPMGTIINQQILVAIAAGLGGIVLGPIWYIWFGITLTKNTN